MFNTVQRYDWPLLIVVLLLISMGLLSIYSVDLSRGGEITLLSRQAIAAVLGGIVCIIASRWHKTRYESTAQWVYLAALGLLVAVLFFGESIRGTTGWFRVAGFSFQPAEFAKLALVLLLAWWTTQQARQFDQWSFVLSSGIATGLLGGLILLQPDLGSASVLFGTWFLLLVFIGAKKSHLAAIVFMGILAIIVAWFFVFEQYQKDRLLVFLQPDNPEFALTTGYNVRQSVIAIGAGQWFGAGLGLGSQSQLHFLPEAQTDFVFAVVGEELGFLGAVFLFTLYALFFWRLVYIARQVADDFAAYTVLGIAALFFIQMIINLGGAMALLPVTGVTLPFVSYGGSSLLINLCLIGIVQSMWRARPHYA